MKGLAIYTIIIYGLVILGALYDFEKDMLIGIAAITPMLVFAILYLVKFSGKKAV